METSRNQSSQPGQGAALNSVQLHLLKMFSYAKSEEQLLEIKKALSEYFFNKVEEGMADLEKQGLWSKQMSEDVLNEHLRTPYIY